MRTSSRIVWASAIVLLLAGVGYANWSESFDGGDFDLTTWEWLSYPQVKNTYTQTLKATEDGNGYLALAETTAASATELGAAFGVGFGSNESFTDVRVGATVNVVGDASHSYCGLAARSSYIVNDGTMVLGAAPGIVASCYVMHVNWEDGPANLRIDIEKVVNLQNIMRTNFDVYAPGLDNARSFYAELDVVGSNPVYVTGSLYEYQGGPLVAQTATMVDTSANDSWEDPDVQNEPFTQGPCGIFAQNENETPPGFYTTFDDISSVSDGPAAVVPSPANGATGVSMSTALGWVEAEFATGRQLWFGPAGDMQLVDPAPAGKSYDPGLLESGQAYEWRVDQVGPAGVVQGRTWTFTTGQGIYVDDFESYTEHEQMVATWVDNIPGEGFDYALIETGKVYQDARAMRLDYQNQFDPFLTEATRTFESPQDWTVKGVDMLSLSFRGEDDNVEQPLYVRLQDAAGTEATVVHPLAFGVQSEPWRSWDIPLVDFAGVDLQTIESVTIGTGDGTDSGQADQDVDTIYIDALRLGFLPAAQ